MHCIISLKTQGIIGPTVLRSWKTRILQRDFVSDTIFHKENIVLPGINYVLHNTTSKSALPLASNCQCHASLIKWRDTISTFYPAGPQRNACEMVADRNKVLHKRRGFMEPN